MRGWKRFRGYMISVVWMWVGLTLMEILLHHRRPSVLVLTVGAFAGITIEAIGNNADQMRAIMFSKQKQR